MHVWRIWRFVGLLMLSVCLSGCGGGGTRVQSETTTTTLGQELKDLDEAYQKGIISQEEYEKSKQRIIKQRTK